jgi:hypothetical protein
MSLFAAMSLSVLVRESVDYVDFKFIHVFMV